ncbi:MAG TPA: Fic family protein [Bacteroidia bacterium]|nr:Fic family protein [Bacteroidia bacterium]
MRPIEKAPPWFKDEYYSKAISLRKKDPRINDLIEKINQEYLYWDRVKYQKAPGKISPEIIWILTKLSRVLSGKKLSFGKYKFTYNLTDIIQKGLHEFDLHIGGDLGATTVVPAEDKNRYLVSSIMEEAIASSQIEGAVTTRRKAKEMLRKNIRPRNKSEQMIVNNYRTIKYIVDIQNEPITAERLFEIHRLIVNRTLEDPHDEGKYRSDNEVNVIDAADNEVVYTPPDFKEVASLMKDLFVFFNSNDEKQFIHPIIKGCIIHFMIGYIHPFVDGNGRTARALFYWYLLKNGYWLTEYLSISRLIVKSKVQYAKAYVYTETDDNDLTYFLIYKIKTMQLAYADLKSYIQSKIKEKKHLIAFQKIEGINERQAFILKWMHDEPDIILTIKEIETRFNISNQTARTDLTTLQKMGYLETMGLDKKTKAFYKSAEFEKLLKKVL